MFRAIFFFCLGAATTYFAAGHHVVKASTGMLIVPRVQVAFSDIYVDITGWKAEDFKNHPKLVEAMVKDGHGDLVVGQAGNSAIDDLRERIDGWLKGSKK